MCFFFVEIPGFCEGAQTAMLEIHANVECKKLLGERAVYCVCFGMSVIFLTLCFLTINAKKKSHQAVIHKR